MDNMVKGKNTEGARGTARGLVSGAQDTCDATDDVRGTSGATDARVEEGAARGASGGLKKPELLAPAGNKEALHAAVCAGVDAIYLGLENFNARRNAGNFTLNTFSEAAVYAHMRGVKLYVTLNTLVLPHEFDAALELARQAYRAGADAFIVQDIGLASEIARVLPQVRLHISTQMNIHNKAGIRAAAHLGATRVTLARELSLAEIAELAQEAAAYKMEVETFAHGALCICYSGQCLMSSLIGGRSANRGLCAQACRLPYELKNCAVRKSLPTPGPYLLSPKDLCAIDKLDQLIHAGVASLKIEGRMKSPDYVSEVCAVYRSALDRAYEQERGQGANNTTRNATFSATPQEKQALEEAFSRGFTTAYLEGKRGNEIMSYKRPNNRGFFVGRVARVSGNKAFINTEYVLNEGDVLEFFTSKGNVTQTLNAAHENDESQKGASSQKGSSSPKSATSHTNSSSYANINSRANTTFRTNAKDGVCVPLDAQATRNVRAGDRIFRVRNAAKAFTYQEFEPRISLDCKAYLNLGKPLRIEFWLAGEGSSAEKDTSAGKGGAGDRESTSAGKGTSAIEGAGDRESTSAGKGTSAGEDFVHAKACGATLEAARTKAITLDEVRAHIDRLGQTPYKIRHLDIDLDEGVGVGFSQIHHVRAEALENLSAQLLESQKNRSLKKESPRKHMPAHHAKGCSLVALASNPACAQAAKHAGASLIYIHAENLVPGQAVIAGQLSETATRTSYPQNYCVAAPIVEHEAITPAPEAKLHFGFWEEAQKSSHAKNSRIFVNSIGALQRAIEEKIPFDVGPHLPVTNKESLQTLARLGAVRVWLSFELTLKQMKELAKNSPVELGVFVAGTQELMVTQHCLLASQGACDKQCAQCARRKSPHYLLDRKSFEFPILTDAFGRSHLYNSVALDVIHTLPELLAAGISSFMVDTTLMSAQDAQNAVARAKRAIHVAQTSDNSLAKMPNTTTGHLFRGVE